MRRILPLTFGLLLLLGACGKEAAADPRDAYLPDDLVLRVEEFGGLPTPEVDATRLPSISVYGDGRVITDGPQLAIFPPPTLPNLLVRTISEDAVAELVDLALRAGVGDSDADYGFPHVLDATGVQFSVSTDAGMRTTAVYALGSDNGLTAAQIRAREPLIRLSDSLHELPTTLGADAVSEEQPYEPVAVATVAWPWRARTDVPPPELRWPGPALPGDPMEDPEDRYSGLHCTPVTGTNLPVVLDAARAANRETPWLWRGERYFVWFRPLLPDESTCDDIGELIRLDIQFVDQS